jgi:hypothetical protein
VLEAEDMAGRGHLGLVRDPTTSHITATFAALFKQAGKQTNHQPRGQNDAVGELVLSDRKTMSSWGEPTSTANTIPPAASCC